MKYNPGYFDQLLVSQPVEDLVMEGADTVAQIARATAPVDTAEYRDGITTRAKRQERVVGLVEATDPKSMIIEARHGTLARAVRAAGKRS